MPAMPHARQVLESWANADWFTSKPELADKVTVTVFKVPGETNTDDLSPAQDAWSRPDIPLHANAMLKNPREGPDRQAAGKIAELKALGHPVAYVGDVVGTGSSRKSATNSVLWHMGDDIPFVSRTSATAVTVSAARSRRSFSTRWKTPARCRSKWT